MADGVTVPLVDTPVAKTANVKKGKKKSTEKGKGSEGGKNGMAVKKRPTIVVSRPQIREPNVFDTALEYLLQFYEVSIKGSQATMKEVEKLGFKEKFLLAGRAAGQLAVNTKDGAFKVLGDGNKAFTKASKLAKKALDFEDDDDALDSSDYDLLLSAAGATEAQVGVARIYTQTFSVPSGHTVVYKCRIKKGDIGFAIREIRVDQVPIDLKPLVRIRSDAQVQGEIKATTRPRNIALVFDNKKLAPAKAAKDLGLMLKSKTVCFWVSTGENASLRDESVGLSRDIEIEAANLGPDEFEN
jgi:hypothetical protein